MFKIPDPNSLQNLLRSSIVTAEIESINRNDLLQTKHSSSSKVISTASSQVQHKKSNGTLYQHILFSYVKLELLLPIGVLSVLVDFN